MVNASEAVTPPRPLVLTPDFATYDWAAVDQAELVDGWVTVTWSDGTTGRFFGLWLWESTVGKGIDPTTRELLVDPADLPVPPVLESVRVGDAGELLITWVDESTDALHPGWLRSVVDGSQQPNASLPPHEQWDGSTWRPDERGAIRPPVIDGSHVLSDDAVLEDWLDNACRYGLALLRGAPATESFITDIAARVGPIRGSNFGHVFSVRSIVNPAADENSVANTGLRLGPHSDLPTRETPPGFQLLHCLQNESVGGWATMTDGLAVMDRLKAEDPAAHDGLVTWPWIFANRSPDADHRWQAPMVELPADGRPLTMRCFYPVRAVPAMDPSDVPAAYRAMAAFSKLARSPELMIRFPYAPGDAILFDNRRILHGRDEYDPSSGSRHLRGCYFDHDDVYSRLRVLRRNPTRREHANELNQESR